MTEKREYIRYSAVEMPQALDATELKLLEKEAPVYQQLGTLVQLIRLDARQAAAESERSGIVRQPGALLVHPINNYLLLELFLRHADYAIYSAVKNKYVRGAPPLSFASHYLARGTWGLRVLRGIVEAPTLRPDGTVLEKPGYDEASGLYLDTGGVKFPAVPDRPSHEDAEHALALLKDVIKDFPFVPDENGAPAGALSAGRSVALSAMLTGGCRKSIRTAPAHGFDAPSMESGKTLLCDSVSLIWNGRSASAISQGGSTEEFDKRLFSILLQGDPMVVIDNVSEPVRSDEFCKVLTAEETQGRVLGQSVNRRASTKVLWLMNGNGLTFEGDIRTRVVLSRLDAQVENPGERKFDRDLRAYLPENRTRLVAAALTVLRAFIVAKRPGVERLSAFGRFEDWSNLVRGALVWLGEPDPVATREVVAAQDPEKIKHTELMTAWERAVAPQRWLTATELLSTASDPTRAFEDCDPLELDLAVSAITPMRSAKVLGRYLSEIAGRISGGLVIRKHATVGHSTKFMLERLPMSSEAGQARQAGQ